MNETKYAHHFFLGPRSPRLDEAERSLRSTTAPTCKPSPLNIGRELPLRNLPLKNFKARSTRNRQQPTIFRRALNKVNEQRARLRIRKPLRLSVQVQVAPPVKACPQLRSRASAKGLKLQAQVTRHFGGGKLRCLGRSWRSWRAFQVNCRQDILQGRTIHSM